MTKSKQAEWKKKVAQWKQEDCKPSSEHNW